MCGTLTLNVVIDRNLKLSAYNIAVLLQDHKLSIIESVTSGTFTPEDIVLMTYIQTLINST